MISKRYLWLECIGLFGGLPLVILVVHQRFLVVGILWLAAFFAYGVMKRRPGFSFRAEWNAAALRSGIKEVLPRFIGIAALIAAFTVLAAPQGLFSLPRERPILWLFVMALYPPLSAFPQEIIYRGFFLTRYQPILGRGRLAASASAFGWAHVVFLNAVAVGFTALGGLLFGDTYLKHKSLALVCLEHALYGCFIFTIGLGWYFYGAAWGRH